VPATQSPFWERIGGRNKPFGLALSRLEPLNLRTVVLQGPSLPSKVAVCSADSPNALTRIEASLERRRLLYS
jgi:hypothetical protein